MQIHPAAKLLRQGQQGCQGFLLRQSRTPIGRPEHPAEQAAPIGHLPGEGLALGARPIQQRHQGHQLQINPALPTLAQGQQGPPTGLGPRAAAVDMGAHRPQAIAPTPLQGRFRAGQHLGLAALAMLPLVLGQGLGHGALPVGEEGPGEGLVQVGMGLHQRGQGQGQRGAITARGKGLDRHNRACGVVDLHRHQPLLVGPGQGLKGRIQQAARHAHLQGPGQGHGAHEAR